MMSSETRRPVSAMAVSTHPVNVRLRAKPLWRVTLQEARKTRSTGLTFADVVTLAERETASDLMVRSERFGQ